jgi:hypothetical protein
MIKVQLPPLGFENLPLSGKIRQYRLIKMCMKIGIIPSPHPAKEAAQPFAAKIPLFEEKMNPSTH